MSAMRSPLHSEAPGLPAGRRAYTAGVGTPSPLSRAAICRQLIPSCAMAKMRRTVGAAPSSITILFFSAGCIL